MAKVLDCSFGVSEFKLKLCYCIHFPTHTSRERYESPYSSNNGLNTMTSVLQG